MLDIAQIADNLVREPNGCWSGQCDERISYPAEGNDLCFTLEDTSFWFRHRNQVIVEAVRQFPPSGPIFDIGGGNGYVAQGLERAGFPAVVVEPGHAGAANARRRGLQHVICSTVDAARFRDHSLDAIGMFDVLEHIEDDGSFLAVLRRLMKPGGRAYVTVPALESLWSFDDDLSGHYRRYTIRSLRAALERADFAVEYLSYFFWLLPVPMFVFRALPSRLGFRRSLTPEAVHREHSSGGGIMNRLLRNALHLEVARLRNRKGVPFGSSCLAVARCGAEAGAA